jgi:hypothetical protein
MTRATRLLAIALLAFSAASLAGPGKHAPPTPPAAPTPPAGAVEGGGGILYGEHHAAVLQAPPGWIFDNASGQGEGLQAVLYRKGETWAKSPGVMYAIGDDATDGRRPDLDAFIAGDLARLRKGSPKAQSFELPAIDLPDHTHVRVVGYRGDRWGNVEAVAYVPQDAAVIVLTLSTHSQARFDRDLPDFRAFVRSYVPMDVTIQRAPGG